MDTNKHTKTIAEPASEGARAEGKDFIRVVVDEDMRTGKYQGQVVTRFPPEPNGYPHIGHAKSICLNFGLAQEYGGYTTLRMDDTNPTTEDMKYVEALERDARWLGFAWQGEVRYASSYFEQMYQLARQLIQDGHAYVDSQSEEEIRDYRGTVLEAGRISPYRDRSLAENLELFEAMRLGEFADGAHVLRGKGDMAAANMKMRDPLLYRIRRDTHHYRTGGAWCIYPMYDYAHPVSDVIEGITHSICTLEFENNRDIYNWVVERVQPLINPQRTRPYQHEFARLVLDYTVVSKRKLLTLVEEGLVAGWDDPRMPTLAGLRRRGVTPEAIRAFCDKIGIAKTNSRVDIDLLDHCIRDDLNTRAPRVMGVLRPLRVVIENYPAEQVEEFDAPYWPYDIPKAGSRSIPFSRELYIEQDDFAEQPPKGFHRLAPGQEVRLRYAYIICCTGVSKDPVSGQITEVRCTYNPASRGGASGDGRKVKGTIHWVSAAQAITAEVRLYDRLFSVPDPEGDGREWRTLINPTALEVIPNAQLEPSLATASAGTRFQFERQGYFAVDSVDSQPGALVFNRIVELRDSWAKQQTSGQNPLPTIPAKAVMPNVGEPARRTKTEARQLARTNSPELNARFARYVNTLALTNEEADVLTGDPAVADFFEATLQTHNNPKLVATWVLNEVLRELKESSLVSLPFGPTQLGQLLALIENNTISTAAAKTVFAEMMKTGGDPQRIVQQRGLQQLSDTAALLPIVEQVITQNAAKAAEYRAGKSGLLGFFVGQALKATGGKANPQLVQELVRKTLDNG